MVKRTDGKRRSLEDEMKRRKIIWKNRSADGTRLPNRQRVTNSFFGSSNLCFFDVKPWARLSVTV